jgi:CubicO group peptidase (beta-lactamase class C family)
MKRNGAKVRLDGHAHSDFRAVRETLENQLRNDAGGAAVCVYHRGECVVDLWGGYADEDGTPWRQDTMAPSFSTTKGVASTLVHIIADRGLIDYDERVAHYWPEFAQAGKQDITVRQVLTHQSGLYHIRQMIDMADRMLDWDHMIAAIEQTEPAHVPGERTGYHGLTYGYLVGEILQRVTGESFSDLVAKELAEPLELDGLYIGAPEEALPRAAQLIWPEARSWVEENALVELPGWLEELGAQYANLIGKAASLVGIKLDLLSILDALGPRGIAKFDFGAPDTLRAAIPAGNGLFTARSLARMYAALAGGGELDGVKLMSRETVVNAIEAQEEAVGRAVLPFDMRWRLGYHGILTSRGAPPGAFGHFGFGGSGAWADSRNELAVAMVVNCGMGTPFGDLRIVRIGGAALSSALSRNGKLPFALSPSLEPCGEWLNSIAAHLGYA